VGNRVGLPLAIDGRGLALRRLGRLEEARAAFEEAIEGYRASDAPRGIAESSNNLGEVLSRLGRTTEARTAFTTAYDLAAPRPSDRARALVGLAQLDRALGDLGAARARADEAITLLDGVRGNIIRDVQRASWAATVSGAYNLVVELALAAGDIERAFLAVERMRARTLVEALARAGHGGTEPSASQPDHATGAAMTEAARASLDDSTALVLLRLGDRGSQAFVLQARGRLQVLELPARALIEASAHSTHIALASPTETVRLDDLSAMIGSPIASATTGARRLVIVPDGALHFVPFELMPALEDRELAYLPSLSTLTALRVRARDAAGGPAATAFELAIFADPLYAPDDPRVAMPHPPASGATLARLRWSKLEAERVAATVPAARRLLFLGPDATVDQLRSREVATARVVHIATHATADATLPERSALQLSSVDALGRPIESDLHLAQIQSLQWRAELVVLSGCHTAGGALFRGEGMIGLTGGFLTAGARQVVASLWQVDDQATAELMWRFHGARARGKTTYAALAEARDAIRSDPRWQAPYYWASFVVYGDWRDDRGGGVIPEERR
jgi:CHAT domain-containing protein